MATVLVLAVDLADGVGAWFTGRDTRTDPAVGAAGNLSHHRPHLPTELARDRAAACASMGLSVDRLHLMRQVHGSAVGVVDAATPLGAELRAVDASVTDVADRPLAVQVADCVPVLLAAGPAVGVTHAGRRGVVEGVVPAAVTALTERAEGAPVRAAIGPAIGGCCYEVSADVQDRLGAMHPEAVTETTWGTPSVDLAVAVRSQLEAAGATVVSHLAACTRCDPEQRWFSHRADPGTGRQLGVVVRHGAGRREAAGERAA